MFSLYGNGNKKQLLWDACKKISNSRDEVTFLGTGNETRDFIHISDVLNLFDRVIRRNDKFLIINGGTGIKSTVKSVVEMLREIINTNVKISFNNQVNPGNPLYYWADIHKLINYDFKAKKKFKQELINYVEWVKSLDD